MTSSFFDTIHGRMALLLLLLLSACSGPRQAQREEDDAFPSFPTVTLSADVIHSPEGDMTARVPKDWVLIDAARLESPGVFAVACDTSYTMGLIFTEVEVDNAAREGFTRRGLRGLAEASFERRQRRSGNRAVLVGEIEEFAIGRRLFSSYTYTTDSSRTLTRTAVFFTSSHLYECAVTHLTFGNSELPSERMLADIHQLVLGTIEW